MLRAGGWLDGRPGVEGSKTRGRSLWSALLGLLPEYNMKKARPSSLAVAAALRNENLITPWTDFGLLHRGLAKCVTHP